MTNTTSPPLSVSTPANGTATHGKARRSHAANADVVRAKATLAALPPLLPGIAKKDAKGAKVRIDQPWLTQYASVIATAEQATAGGTLARVDERVATADELKKGLQLSLLLTDVRALVATHNPDDLAGQQAYGRGETIDPRRTSPLVNIAGAYLAAWDGKWKEPAVDAGVTQATIDQIQALRDALSAADIDQHGVGTTNEGATVSRAAALSALRQMSAFAVRVVTNVFGRGSSQARSLSDPRPLANRASERKAATKAKSAAAKGAKKAKKSARLAKPGPRTATAKGGAKRGAAAAQAKAVVASAAKKKVKGGKGKRTAKRAK